MSTDTKFNPNANNSEKLSSIHTEYSLEIINADQVTIKQQPWFWKGIIPLETSTLFAGPGNSGKSQLLLFLAAHTTNGKEFKAGGTSHQLPQGNVIILSGEDKPETQLVPRLIAAEAILSKVKIIKMMKIGAKRKLLDLSLHLLLLEEAIIKAQDAGLPTKLIIVDPVQYFTGEMKDYINANVCHFISELNELADKYQLALIMNKHLRKKEGGEGISSAVDAVSGSGAWTTSPRSCWLIHRHPSKEGVILFADLKSNLKAKDSQSMAYKIESTGIDNPNIPGERIETTSMQWCDELEDLGADEALSSPSIPPMEQRIRKWIVSFLVECGKNPNNGYMFKAADFQPEAAKEGFKKTYFNEVRRKMRTEEIIEENYFDNGKEKMVKLCDPDLHK